MPKKVTFVIPDSVFDKLQVLRQKLDLSTASGVAAISIEILDWTVSKIDEGFEIKAIEKEENLKKASQQCPLIYSKRIDRGLK